MSQAASALIWLRWLCWDKYLSLGEKAARKLLAAKAELSGRSSNSANNLLKPFLLPIFGLLNQGPNPFQLFLGISPVLRIRRFGYKNLQIFDGFGVILYFYKIII